MIRLIASLVLEVLANAVGLLAASWILRPDFSIDPIGFITVVAIFTAAHKTARANLEAKKRRKRKRGRRPGTQAE